MDNKLRMKQLEKFKMITARLEKDKTFEYTNIEMAKYLISLINFKDGDIVIEPCKGGGAFYDNLPNNIIKKYCEINEGKDYLEFNERVDITLSNPPFVPRKLFWEFMKKAMTTTNREIWWLINMRSLEVFTGKRLKEMNELKWFMNSMHITGDKRWRGRYVWCKFTKIDNNFLSSSPKTF